MERYASASGLSAAEAAPSGPMCVRELFIWLTAILAANHALHVLDTRSIEALGASLASVNVIFFIACFAIFERLRASDAHRPADAIDTGFGLAIAAMACLLAVFGYRFTGGVLVTIVALYAGLRYGPDPNLKAASVVMLALSVHLVWGPAFFQFFALELLRADATLVGTLFSYLRPDIVWTDTSFQRPDGNSITLAAACSSFHNISMAMLCCVSVIMLVRTTWQRSDVWTILAACAAMIALNVVRICLLGWSASSHAYWHDGAGVPILALAMTAVLLMIAFWGARRGDREQ